MSQYLQYLQSYREIFIRHLAAAVPLLQIDNLSPVCRYIIEICRDYALFWWIVSEKIAFCLQRSGTKYRYFHLGQREHRCVLAKAM